MELIAASRIVRAQARVTGSQPYTDKLNEVIANVGAALRHVRAAAEQFKDIDPWATMLRYVSEKIAPTLGPFRPLQRLPATG